MVGQRETVELALQVGDVRQTVQVEAVPNQVSVATEDVSVMPSRVRVEVAVVKTVDLREPLNSRLRADCKCLDSAIFLHIASGLVRFALPSMNSGQCQIGLGSKRGVLF